MVTATVHQVATVVLITVVLAQEEGADHREHVVQAARVVSTPSKYSIPRTLIKTTS